MLDAQAPAAVWSRAHEGKANHHRRAINEPAMLCGQHKRRREPRRDYEQSIAARQSRSLSDRGGSALRPQHRSGNGPLRALLMKLNGEHHGSRSPHRSHHFAR
jgi:hypothetical protein